MKRNFNFVNDNELDELKSDVYSKQTEAGIKTVKRTFNMYLEAKNTLMPTNDFELDKLLQYYWPSLRTVKNEHYTASSLLNYRQLLRCHFKRESGTDIIYGSAFVESNRVFNNFLKSLKSIGKGCVKYNCILLTIYHNIIFILSKYFKMNVE